MICTSLEQADTTQPLVHCLQISKDLGRRLVITRDCGVTTTFQYKAVSRLAELTQRLAATGKLARWYSFRSLC